MKKVTEERLELIKRARTGDGEAFMELSGDMRDKLFHTALIILSNEADALEALDEAMFQAWRGVSALRQPEFFDTWLTRIVINCCTKILRQRKREIVTEFLPEAAAEAYDALPMQDAVARLPEELRLVISLRFFADLTVPQTAAVLEIPEGTVKTRQRKALALLRVEWEEE